MWPQTCSVNTSRPKLEIQTLFTGSGSMELLEDAWCRCDSLRTRDLALPIGVAFHAATGRVQVPKKPTLELVHCAGSSGFLYMICSHACLNPDSQRAFFSRKACFPRLAGRHLLPWYSLTGSSHHVALPHELKKVSEAQHFHVSLLPSQHGLALSPCLMQKLSRVMQCNQ